MHKPKALLTAWVQVVVDDPLDPSPLVNDRLNVLGLGDYALQHWVPPCGVEECNWRSSGALHPAAAGARASRPIENVAHSIAAYNSIAAYKWRESCTGRGRCG